jgi:energy-coupling factor transport system permease protein
MNGMVIGQYMPAQSFLHRLDPRAKLVVSSLFIISCFLVNAWTFLAVFLILEGIAIASTGLPVSFFLRNLRPVLFFVFLTVGLQVFFNHQGNIIFELGFLRVTDQGLSLGLFMAVRLVIVIIMSTLLTLTTKPSDLTLALESLMKPLKAVKFPVAELALMISIALRFVPTLFEETHKILKSQASRGVDIKEGSIKEKISQLISLLVPLFILSFKRAEDLANAMEVRGYVPGRPRTSITQLHWTSTDTILMIFGMGLFALAIVF